jgi:hypothetical protein
LITQELPTKNCAEPSVLISVLRFRSPFVSIFGLVFNELQTKLLIYGRLVHSWQ